MPIEITVDRNNEQTQSRASALARGLVEQFGPGDSIAIALITVEELLLAVMHSGTPKVDLMLTEVVGLLDDLKGRVMSHEDCARELAADREEQPETPPARVH